MSHPIRGGWIEIATMGRYIMGKRSPTPYGVGGLKSGRETLSKAPTVSHPMGQRGRGYGGTLTIRPEEGIIKENQRRSEAFLCH